MKRIVYTRPDGIVNIVCPSPEWMATFNSEAEALAALRIKDVPEGAQNIYICDVSEIPTNRRFRGCWRQSGTTPPSVDMPLARAQRMKEIRAERDHRLALSDSLYLRAQENDPMSVSAHKDYRQALRDLPAALMLDAIETPEELDAFVPAWPVKP